MNYKYKKDPRSDSRLVDLILGDAVEYLDALPEESVDMLIADPSYESIEKWRYGGTPGSTARLMVSNASSNPWFKTFPDSRCPELIDSIFRCMKPDSHAYIFCNDETSDLLKPLVMESGFRRVKRIVWDKMKLGMGYRYRARHEFILFLEKGKRRLNDLSIPDVLDIPSLRGGRSANKYYPTQKPVELMEILIEQSSEPGEWVVDPFFGSATVGAAAYKLDRQYTGVDIAQEAVDFAAKRLEAEEVPWSLETLEEHWVDEEEELDSAA